LTNAAQNLNKIVYGLGDWVFIFVVVVGKYYHNRRDIHRIVKKNTHLQKRPTIRFEKQLLYCGCLLLYIIIIAIFSIYYSHYRWLQRDRNNIQYSAYAIHEKTFPIIKTYTLCIIVTRLRSKRCHTYLNETNIIMILFVGNKKKNESAEQKSLSHIYI